MIEGMQRASTLLHKWRTPPALILTYHRITASPADPWRRTVSPHRFAEQMAVLREWAHVLTLEEMVHRLEAGTLPPRAVAVTFDDGYADNLHRALPLLEKYGIPATFFIATGGLGRTREFWWDELERIFLQPGRLPDALGLTLDGARHWWKLGRDAVLTEEAAVRWHTWHAEDPPPTRRHRIFRTIWKRLVHRSEAEQQNVLTQLRAWAGAPRTARPTHRTLTPVEARRLADHELAELGAHTVTHVALDRLEAPQQHAEITHSKCRLEALLGRPVTSFSYPYGRYTRATVQILRSVRFARACTTASGPLRPPVDPLTLPRLSVPNIGHEAFLPRLQAAVAS